MILALIAAAIGAFFFVQKGGINGAHTVASGELDGFAQCLTDNGVTMYGAYWCPHCQEQKKLFGASWDIVNYVECSLPNRGGQTEACINAGIESYPTWEFADGTRQSGRLSLDQLAQKTGCQA